MDVVEKKLRVLIAAKDRTFRDHLRQVLTSTGCCEVAGVAVDGLEAVRMAKLTTPDVAVVKLDLPIYDGLVATRMISMAAPSVHEILVGNGHVDAELSTKAMLAGARACVSAAQVEAELPSLIGIIMEMERSRSSSEYKDAVDVGLLPSIIAVTGGRGGIGKSTVASGLAMCLAMRYPGKVVLLDLYTQFGDIATMLGLKDVRSFADLAGSPDGIDLETIESYMSDHDTNLKVLVACTGITAIDALGPDMLENILHHLKKGYQHTVIDLPPMLHPAVLRVISLCHHLLVVVNKYEIQTVKDGKKLYDLVAPEYIQQKQVGIVVNRVSKHDGITLQRVEQYFGKEAIAQIPNHPQLISAVNQGVPFVQAYSRSPLVRAMQLLAQRLTDSETPN